MEEAESSRCCIEPAKNSKPQIQYEDFAKLELKAGTSSACEKVQKADKLLNWKLTWVMKKGQLYQALLYIIRRKKWQANK